MANKGYVILEKAFEYNDETYNPSEGGNVKKVYTSKEKAEDDRLKFEAEKWSGLEISNYCYSIGDLTTYNYDSIRRKTNWSDITKKVNDVLTIQSGPTIAEQKQKRALELSDKLSGVLSGNALLTAVNEQIHQEFAKVKTDRAQFDADDLQNGFYFPENLTVEQVKQLLEIFPRLSFYEIQETEID